MSRKTVHVPKPEPPHRKAWREAQKHCWLCGTLAINTWPPKIECHEIARGVHREEAVEESCCWIATCQRCHEAHLDSMPIARQLALKKINDPENYDRVGVNRMRNRADEAVTEGEVMVEVCELQGMADGGYPYPRWRW